MADSIKGLSIKIGADTKEFQKEIKKVDKNINATEKQVNALTKSLELNFDSNRFAQAQRLAQDALTKTEQKAQALKDQMEYLRNTGGDVNSEGYRKLEVQLAQTEVKAQELSQKLKEIQNTKITALANQFSEFGSAVSSAGSAIMPLSIAAIGAVVGVGKIGLSSIKTADDLSTLAMQIGLTAEELQKWQYIAMQTDVSDSELQSGLIKVQTALGELASGEASTATKALESLGITAEQASKGMNENFTQLVEALQGIEDPILQANYANELFGNKLGAKIIPMLKSGGEGLKALSEEFENLGYLTNEQVAEFSEFDNVMNRIKYQFSQIKNELGANMLPLMEVLADIVENKIVPAVSKLAGWFGGLSTSQQELVLGITAFIGALGPLLIFVGKISTGISSIIKLIPSIQSGLTALSAHPIIAIIGVIAMLLTVLYAKNEQFRESIDKLIGLLGKALEPILKAIEPILETVSKVIEMIADNLSARLTPMIDALTVSLEPMLDTFNMLSQTLSPLTSLFNKTGISMGLLTGPLQMQSKLLKILSPLYEGFGKLVSKVMGKVNDVTMSIMNKVESAVNYAIKLLNKLISAANKIPGVSISKIDYVDFDESTAQQSEGTTNVAESSISQADGTTSSLSPSTVNNYDYSDKDIVINVTVENYGEEIDTEKLIQEINIKLAQQM